MKIVVQRVLSSSVSVEGERTKYISDGLLVFIGFCSNDTEDDILWGINKLLNMKILKDKKGESNLNTLEKKSDLLVIIANMKGAEIAANYNQISYVGFPFSISENFQMRNTNKTINE